MGNKNIDILDMPYNYITEVAEEHGVPIADIGEDRTGCNGIHEHQFQASLQTLVPGRLLVCLGH